MTYRKYLILLLTLFLGNKTYSQFGKSTLSISGNGSYKKIETFAERIENSIGSHVDPSCPCRYRFTSVNVATSLQYFVFRGVALGYNFEVYSMPLHVRETDLGTSHGPSLWYYHKLNNKWAIGTGVQYSWRNFRVGRFLLDPSGEIIGKELLRVRNTISLALNPSIQYFANERLSLELKPTIAWYDRSANVYSEESNISIGLRFGMQFYIPLKRKKNED